MKIAFCLFKYFPYGGLQRDFLRIARACAARGHEVHVYTMEWQGEPEPQLIVHQVNVRGRTNHAKAKAFSQAVGELLQQGDRPLVVGFNKMAHLDIYYAADVCYQSRVKASKGYLYRLMPRYRTYLALEKAVFADNHTSILLLSAQQQIEYSTCYGTNAERFHLLPPGIERDRIAPPNAAELRAAKRRQLHLKENDLLLLMVGSGFKTKGLSRAILGLAALPATLKARCQLVVIGKGEAEPYEKLASKLGVRAQVHIVGAKKNITPYLLAADCLIHPACHENTGTVLLEALAAGLPVLTTAVCGYAHFITEADAGRVLPLPFTQEAWNTALNSLLMSGQLSQLGANGARFAKQADIYSLPERAVAFIEQMGART